MESIGRILRIGLALIGPPLLVFMLLPGNAQAYTRTVATGSLHAPYMHYTKGTTNTNGYLTAWVSYSSGNRYRTVMQAGSGTTVKNECTKSQGWLPKGTYASSTSTKSSTDSQAKFKFYRKTSGVATVQGWVWELGNHKCTNGTYRTELFIHSNGIEGTTWDGNYKSNGCIKISQGDRVPIRIDWDSAYKKSDGYVTVS